MDKRKKIFVWYNEDFYIQGFNVENREKSVHLFLQAVARIFLGYFYGAYEGNEGRNYVK